VNYDTSLLTHITNRDSGIE